MFIQTEDTPNPQSMKFLPGRAVLGEGQLGVDFPTFETAKAGSPLAALLFETDGVMGVYLGGGFCHRDQGRGCGVDPHQAGDPRRYCGISSPPVCRFSMKAPPLPHSRRPRLMIMKAKTGKSSNRSSSLSKRGCARRWRPTAATSFLSILSRAPGSSFFRCRAPVRDARHRP